MEQAQSFLREITGHIQRNEVLIERYGNLVPKYQEVWTNRAIIVERPAFKLKDPTISCVGSGGTILSKRADLIIGDDILDEENTRTPEQRKKMFDWYVNVLLPVLEPDGMVVIDGTVWHPEDLYHKLMDDPAYDVRIKYKAIIKEASRIDLWDEYKRINDEESADKAFNFFQENNGDMIRGSDVLWPDRWPYGKLKMRQASMGRVAFSRNMQNEVLGEEDQMIKEAEFEAAKERGRDFRLQHQVIEHQFLVVVQGIDPATGSKRTAQSGWSVIVSLGIEQKTGMRRVLNIERGQWKSKELRTNIREQCDRFKPRRIKVESNAFQVTLVQDFKEESSAVADKIKGQITGGEKWDEEIGLDSIALLFENNKIILPYDKTDPRTVRLIEQFIDELRTMQVGHTGDIVMAFWLADRAWREIRKDTSMARIKIKSAGMYNR